MSAGSCYTGTSCFAAEHKVLKAEHKHGLCVKDSRVVLANYGGPATDILYLFDVGTKLPNKYDSNIKYIPTELRRSRDVCSCQLGSVTEV